MDACDWLNETMKAPRTNQVLGAQRKMPVCTRYLVDDVVELLLHLLLDLLDLLRGHHEAGRLLLKLLQEALLLHLLLLLLLIILLLVVVAILGPVSHPLLRLTPGLVPRFLKDRMTLIMTTEFGMKNRTELLPSQLP